MPVINLINSRFKVDLFQMKHAKDPDGLLQAMKDANAAEFGRNLVKQFPYERVKAFEGELPEMSLNKDHEFVDEYESRFVVMSVKTFEEIKQYLPRIIADAL